MMEQGEKIAALRKRKGMTQADLGAALNVTYQAVSKWERGESYPNFDTITQMAKLFDVSINYFANDYNGDEPYDETASTAAQAAESVSKEQSDAREMLGICKDCGNVVYKGDEAQTSPYLLCAKCKERERIAAKRKLETERRQREAEEQAKINARNAVIRATKRKRNIGFIVAALISALLLVIGIVSAVGSSDAGATVLGCIITVIFAFTFISQMIWGGTVRNICCEGFIIIGTPGVIFTLDLDGVIFLIAVKILFAVIRMLALILFMLFFALIAVLVSPFTFIPGIIKLNRGVDPSDD